MRKKYIDQADKFDVYQLLHAKGYSPQQVKEFIIHLLAPYIESRKKLEKYAVSVLANEAINIARISSRPEWKDLFEFTLCHYNKAREQDKDSLFSTMSYWNTDITVGQSNFSNQIKFEVDKKELAIDEFQFECFRNIGTLVEATIQPFLREFLCVIQNRKGLRTLTEVRNMTLGNVVLNIEREIGTHNLIAPQPWRLKLNQWRNLSQHHSPRVENEYILCQYGIHQLKLTRNELLEVVMEIMRRLSVLKGAREIFIFNNIDEISEDLKLGVVDFETNLLELKSAFSTQGFNLIDASEKNDEVFFEIADLRPELNDLRLYHCAQFSLHIHNKFPDKNVCIIYGNKRQDIEFKISTAVDSLKVACRSKDPTGKLFEFVKIEQISKSTYENNPSK